MRKLLFLFIFVINCVFAGEVPIKLKINGQLEGGMHALRIIATDDVNIDHTKIKVNRGKCYIFDTDQFEKEWAKHLMYGNDGNMLEAFLSHDKIINKIVKNIPDMRKTTLKYGEYVIISTSYGCEELLEIEIPTNKGTFKHKF